LVAGSQELREKGGGFIGIIDRFWPIAATQHSADKRFIYFAVRLCLDDLVIPSPKQDQKP